MIGCGYAAVPQGTDEISALIAEIGLAARTPMIDVAVTTSDGLCYAGRFEREPGITDSTKVGADLPRFHSASVSKLFTAVVIMQLRDEQALSLADRVGEFVPVFDGSDIRLQHLLTHTSGLRDRKRAKGRNTRKEVDDYIHSLARQRISGVPGATWNYADAGFNLLGRVIENVTDKTFPDAMRDRLLQPLGMENSSFDLNRIPVDTRVTGFNERGRQLKHPWDLAFLPSSGLQTTARDLAKFAQAVLMVNAGKHVQGLVGVETLRELTSVYTATEWSGVEQGLAWQIVKGKSGTMWRHAGSEAGFESLFAIYPEHGVGIVALGNRKDWPRFQLVASIKDTVGAANTTPCAY